MRYSPQLDGIRGVAISAVLLYHLSYRYFPGGWVGVDLFFVLSGYLITTILWEEYKSTGRIHLKNFYGRRVLRLFPALVLCICLTGIATLFGLTGFKDFGQFAGAAIPALFYFSNFSGDQGVLTHTWSLSVEEQFYLLWPVFLGLVIVRLKPLFKLLVIVVLFTAFGIIRWHLQRNHFAWWPLYVWPYTRADQLMAGVLVAIAVGSWPERMSATLAKLKLFVLPPIGFLTYVLLRTLPWESRWLYTWGFTGIGFASALVLLFSIYASNDALLFRVLNSKVLKWLGKRSYGIYLYHNLPIWIFGHHLPKPQGWVGQVSIRALGLAVSIFVAWLSYRFVESRALALKDRWFPVRRGPGMSSGD